MKTRRERLDAVYRVSAFADSLISQLDALSTLASRIYETRWKFQNLLAGDSGTVPRERYPAIGAAVRLYLRDSDLSALDSILSGYTGRSTGLDAWLSVQGIKTCANCESLFLKNDDDAFFSETYSGQCCANCMGHHVLVGGDWYDTNGGEVTLAQSGRQAEEWISAEDARECSDGITRTKAWAENCGYYWQDDNGTYIDYDPDEIDEDGDRGDSEGIYGYHSHPQRGDRYFSESSKAGDPAFGFELEIYTEGGLYNEMENVGLEWVLERDGSLDDNNGVEIVSPPRTLATWKKVVPALAEALEECDAKGYSVPNGQYGMHVSVHRRHLTPLQEARIGLFLACEENKNFVQAIAQRSSIYCAQLDIGGIKAHIKGKVGELKDLSRNVPLNLNPGRRDETQTGRVAEFRIFQSTTRADRILKNLEFCAALVRWTSTKSSTGSEYRFEPFLKWLKGYGKEYPNLKVYIGMPEHSVKGIGKVARTWGV